MGFFQEIINGLSPAALVYNKTKPKDSSAAANQYLNQIPGVAEKNLSPYIMPGQQSQDFINQIMQGYKPSEGYNFQKNELQKELGGNAIPGGRRDEEQRGALIQKLLSGDMQNWLDNVLGVHNKSYDASRELNDIESGNLNQQGGLAFRGVEGNNARNAALRDALIGLAGQAIGGGAGATGGGGGNQLGDIFKSLFSGGGNQGQMQQNNMNQGSQWQNSGLGGGQNNQLYNRAPRASTSTVPGSQFGGY